MNQIEITPDRNGNDLTWNIRVKGKIVLNARTESFAKRFALAIQESLKMFGIEVEIKES